MRVGIYTDLRNPPPRPRPPRERYERALERIAEAERLGAGSVWLTEHHLFEDGYLPQPLVFAAAVAARTHSLRIGTAVLLAPLRPAIDIAEQAAVVDVLSGGRLELGLGAGYRVPEFEAFGVDVRERFVLLERRVREIRELLDTGPATPRPIQDRLPLWIGGMGPRAARLAGRTGEGMLSLASSLREPYLAALQEGGHDPSTARMAGLANLILADDPEAAWSRIAPRLAYQRDSYNRAAVEGDRAPSTLPPTLTPGTAPVDVESMRRPAAEAIAPAFDVVTAEEAIERLTAWLGRLPTADVYLWETLAGMPDDLADRHVELVAGRLAPALAGVGIPAAQ